MSYVVPFGGQRLDRIARATLRTERNGAVEALLAVNPGLAELAMAGAVVPAGTTIAVPDDFKPVARNTGIVLAWD